MKWLTRTNEELRIEAHKLYSDACRYRRRYVVPIYRKKGFEAAIREFGDAAKKNHLLRYLHDPNRQEKIENHFKERLQWFDYVFAADPQDSGESFRTLVSDTYESVEAAYLQNCGETPRRFVPDFVPESVEAYDLKDSG
uniref:Uncharacterized protein n=1 Tax=Medicago truncatula TaxID=3880 RepID=Q2HVN1_MEDTR|nr:hypothetical protein MtrDRAFT_AC148816g36v2 [Medicago truncatula]